MTGFAARAPIVAELSEVNIPVAGGAIFGGPHETAHTGFRIFGVTGITGGRRVTTDQRIGGVVLSGPQARLEGRIAMTIGAMRMSRHELPLMNILVAAFAAIGLPRGLRVALSERPLFAMTLDASDTLMRNL